MKCPRCLPTTGALIGGIWLREPMVAMPGVEPRMGESKSRALPFGYIAIKKRQISLSLRFSDVGVLFSIIRRKF